MKKTILTAAIFFFAMIATTSLFADSKIDDGIKKLKVDYSSSQSINDLNNDNDVLLARRSGGRSGSRSFSSRRSSSRSTGYSGSRRGSSRSTGYSSGRRRSGGSFIYIGGGSSRGGSGVSIFAVIIVILIIVAIIYFVMRRRNEDEYYDDGYGAAPVEDFDTIKLQFALYATAESFKDEIMSLAEDLDYDSEEDLKTLVNETSMLLVQNQDYVKYAYVKQAKTTRNIDNAERDFDSFINEETAKFSQITFQNRGGNVRDRDLSDANKPDFMEIDEYFIISLVVSYANTKMKINKDNYAWSDYEGILKNTASISSNNIVATEIIWSPDAKEDILTEDDIITHYPYMVQL